MLTFIIRRILWGILAMAIVIAVTFVLFYVLPTANPAVLRAGRNASPKTIAYISAELGINKPIYTQFWDYVKNIVFHFNLGYSFYSDAPVRGLIADRLPATISLALGSVFITLLAGLPVGIISAIRRRSFFDRISMGTSLVFVSAPTYWLGLIAIYLFASDIGRFKVFDGSGSYVPLTTNVGHWFGSLIMPWLVLAAGSAAVYARILRGSLIDVMGEDYIRTARAKGLRERRVIMRHGVRSAITPIVTIVGLDIGALLGGAVLTETVFDIPGIGRLNYDAITHSDFPIVQGTVLVAALFIIIANIVVDIGYAYLDPRVRPT
ncbi:MAG TPA: ABC transporter permease [Solirubrobacteraceae bacterium]|jgi:peptide/nickel transport system permease protein|nr:ABC transporter permease [Solirubrobacteraceae bacterium]